jgi:hypothetical protein
VTAASYFYVSAKHKIATGVIDLDTDTLGVMLVTDTYTPAAAHDFRNDVTNEASGTGYTTSGQALTGVTVTISGEEVRIDCDDPSWATATITARAAIFYKRRGGASSADELICSCRFTPNADVTSTAGTFTVQIPANGFAALT